jgi:hypothetical protein
MDQKPKIDLIENRIVLLQELVGQHRKILHSANIANGAFFLEAKIECLTFVKVCAP